MTTYLYGLLLAGSAARPPSPVPGIGGPAVRVLDCGDLAAVISSPPDAVTRTRANAVAHDAVLKAFVDAGATVAAVRFGQSFESDADCRREVAGRSARVRDLLREADGCVEMRVVLELPDADVAAPVTDAGPAAGAGPGRAYLESLRAGSRRVTSVSVRDALGPMVRDERVEEYDGGRGVTIAHLIRRADEVRYRVAVAALPGLSGGAIVGPLALYSFAEPM